MPGEQSTFKLELSPRAEERASRVHNLFRSLLSPRGRAERGGPTAEATIPGALVALDSPGPSSPVRAEAKPHENAVRSEAQMESAASQSQDQDQHQVVAAPTAEAGHVSQGQSCGSPRASYLNQTPPSPPLLAAPPFPHERSPALSRSLSAQGGRPPLAPLTSALPPISGQLSTSRLPTSSEEDMDPLLSQGSQGLAATLALVHQRQQERKQVDCNAGAKLPEGVADAPPQDPHAGDVPFSYDGGIPFPVLLPSQPPQLDKTTRTQFPVSDLTTLHANHMRLTIYVPVASVKVNTDSLVALAKGAHPYTHNGQPTETVISRVPPALTDVFFLPMEMSTSICSVQYQLVDGWLGGGVVARLYIFFPSSMKAPTWLRQRFTMLRGHQVDCKWGNPMGWKRLTLRLDRKYEAYQQQAFTIWYSKAIVGSANRMQLFGPGGGREALDMPYLMGFKFAWASSALSLRKSHGTGRNRDMTATSSSDRTSPSTQFSPGLQGPLRLEDCMKDEEDMTNWIIRMGGSVNQVDAKGTPRSLLSCMLQTAVHKQATTDVLQEMLFGMFQTTFMKQLRASVEDFRDVERAAFQVNDSDMMIHVIEATDGALGMQCLQFLIHAWAHERLNKSGTSVADARANRIEAFLVKHVIRKPNPLSITAAVLFSIAQEVTQFDMTDKVLQRLQARFRSLHMAFLTQLKLRMSNIQTRRTMLHRMVKILQPLGSREAGTANEVSPLTIAMLQRDYEFMCHPALVSFFATRWEGWEFVECSVDNADTISIIHSTLGYRILRTMGLAGGPLDIIISLSMRVLHAYAINSLIFFNSPRGRWAMHALCETLFVTLYQILAIYPQFSHRKVFDSVFFFFVIGNLGDVLSYVRFQYGSIRRAGMVLRDPWDTLNVITNTALLAFTVAMTIRDSTSSAEFPDYAPGDGLHMGFCACAIFVWARTLSMIVPVFKELGPLLNTVWKMTAEILAFLFPFALVLAGFATLFTGVYNDTISAYSSFIIAVMNLFSATLGNFDYTQFEQDDNGNELSLSMRTYGVVFLTIYLLISNIMLLNLLIAIITTRYEPQSSFAETQFKQAGIVSYYSNQVEHHLVCSPFNVVHALFIWIPSYERKRTQAKPEWSWMLVFVPPDGLAVPDDSNQMFIPRSGKDEFPNLCFLLTLYPIMAIISAVAYIVYFPVSTIHFALNSGWRQLLQRIQPPNQVTPVHGNPSTGIGGFSDEAGKFLGGAWDGFEKSRAGLRKAVKAGTWNTAMTPFSLAGSLVIQLFFLACAIVVGVIMYVVLGIVFFFIMTVWWWAAKVVFSLWNLLIYPWCQLIPQLMKEHKRRQYAAGLRAIVGNRGTGKRRQEGGMGQHGARGQEEESGGDVEAVSASNVSQPMAVQRRLPSIFAFVRQASKKSHVAETPTNRATKTPLQRLKEGVRTALRMRRDTGYLSRQELDKSLKASKFAPFLESWGIINGASKVPTVGMGNSGKYGTNVCDESCVGMYSSKAQERDGREEEEKEEGMEDFEAEIADDDDEDWVPPTRLELQVEALVGQVTEMVSVQQALQKEVHSLLALRSSPSTLPTT